MFDICMQLVLESFVQFDVQTSRKKTIVLELDSLRSGFERAEECELILKETSPPFMITL